MKPKKIIDLSKLSTDVADRFWKYVEKTDTCWNWIAGRNRAGYGQFKFNGISHNAHRVSYAIFYNEDPWPMIVCHRCDNPHCVNPMHLYAGTHFDNARDTEDRGRSNRRIGPRSPKAKLTEIQVIEARNIYASGELTQKQLAQKYNVSKQTMNDIIQGNVYTQIGGPTSRRNILNEGSRNPNAKLTEDQVIQIRRMYSAGNYRVCDLARLFNLGHHIVNDVVKFRTWKNLNV